MPTDGEEAGLAQRLRHGDESAVSELVKSYAIPLIRFAHTIVKDRARAESIAYDVLSDVWLKRADIKPDRSLKGYLFTAVHRRSLDEIAHERVVGRHAEMLQREAVLDPDSYASASPDEGQDDIDSIAFLKDKVESLRGVIAQLPERRRLALHLRFEQGLSYPEMGNILMLSDKAAQQLVIRTIAALRRELGI